MPRSLRIAVVLVAFGLAGLLLGGLDELHPRAGRKPGDYAVALAAGQGHDRLRHRSEAADGGQRALTCRRVAEVGGLEIGLGCKSPPTRTAVAE